MKSIARKDFTAIGTIDKTHGTKGEMSISIDTNMPVIGWAFLEIQEKPVPFYVESIQPTFDDRAIWKLKDIETLEEASMYIGKPILMPKVKNRKKEVYAEDDFTGFLLHDSVLGEIGTVMSIEEYPNQLIITTEYKGMEVLIPAVEAFIIRVDESKKTIYLNLPEGLLSI